MTDKEWKELARILRDDQLPAATQWKIVCVIWVTAMAVIGASYFSALGL